MIERDWGDSHFAVLYAKIKEKITLKDVDQRAYELVSEHLKPVKDEIEKAQLMIMFQLLSEALKPEEYEYTKENGALGMSGLTGPLYSYKHLMEIAHDFPGAHTKVSTRFGYLLKTKDEKYDIWPWKNENSLGAGFYLEIWNNHQASIGKDDVEKMMSKVTDVIKEKYSNFVEILYQASW
jgi:hypothetical protein